MTHTQLIRPKSQSAHKTKHLKTHNMQLSLLQTANPTNGKNYFITQRSETERFQRSSWIWFSSSVVFVIFCFSSWCLQWSVMLLMWMCGRERDRDSKRDNIYIYIRKSSSIFMHTSFPHLSMRECVWAYFCFLFHFSEIDNLNMWLFTVIFCFWPFG